MKVTIIGGAGVVGASAAYRIAQDGRASEILLIDAHRNQAEAHALDIGHAVCCRSTTRLLAGEIEDSVNSDVIIMTAAVPHRSTVTSRSEFLQENLPIVLSLTEKLAKYSPNASWVMVTIPVDTLSYLLHKLYSIPKQKIIGLNRNDTCRFRQAISKTLKVPSTSVEAFVLGEHGQTQVPIFSQIKINGKPVMLSSDEKNNVKSEISTFFKDWNRLNPGRTAGWTSAESLGDVLLSMGSKEPKIWNCSTPLEGEYGLYEVSLGVPVKLGLQGVEKIVALELDNEEREALRGSANTLKNEIQAAAKLVGRSL